MSDIPDSVVECVNEPFEDLGVSIEGRERAIENVVEVLQTHLQPRFGLHTLDVHLDFAQADVDARNHLEEVREFRSEREVGFQVLDIDVDLVDFALADVYENIRIVTRFASLEMLAVEPFCTSRARRCSSAAASVAITGLVGSRHNLSSRRSATGTGFGGVGLATGAALAAGLAAVSAA